MMTASISAAAANDRHRLEATELSWRWTALALLSVRFIQGFIYWGGGSRRFIYAPAKLNPDSAHWMANKFQSAMPGALLGTDKIIAFLLHHFSALYPALIAFSGLELLCGLGLIFGLFTRLSALGTIFFSIALMLMFGWQGATCIDEWTMAASNLAMGASLILLGGGAYSLDNLLLRHWPALEGQTWFRWICGSLPLPLSIRAFPATALAILAFTVVFNVATYSYYRGSVITPFHSGPVSPSKHHYTLTNSSLQADGGVTFHAYLDGGTPAVASHLVQASITDATGHVIAVWDMAALSALPKAAIHNDFTYNQVKTGPYGLVAEVGAMATITLPARGPVTANAPLNLNLTNVSGKVFHARLQSAAAPA